MYEMFKQKMILEKLSRVSETIVFEKDKIKDKDFTKYMEMYLKTYQKEALKKVMKNIDKNDYIVSNDEVGNYSFNAIIILEIMENKAVEEQAYYKNLFVLNDKILKEKIEEKKEEDKIINNYKLEKTLCNCNDLRYNTIRY